MRLEMELHGKNFIGEKHSSAGTKTFNAQNPSTGETLAPQFREATESEVDEALQLATNAFEQYRREPPEKVAAFLTRVAEEISKLGDELIRRAQAETALPEARLIGERARTINQITMFADLVREGSWVDARIDRALPERKPLPKPDLRRMLIPIGPVGVFAASNFPLAFSVAGGDTISALAAGNPVILKAHPAHPGTSELTARAIESAVKAAGIPAGVFSMIQGVSHEVGLRLVRHPALKAVAFTGSLNGGRALFDAGASRPEPIPVFAEMGSTNPVFVLPGALNQRAGAIAEGLVQSVTLGVGQFCTNPGLVFGVAGAEWSAFAQKTAELAGAFAPAAMLYSGICERYQEGINRVSKLPAVHSAGKSTAEAKRGQAGAAVFAADAATFMKNQMLQEELFGPSTLLIKCSSKAELQTIARSLPGQLTATIQATEQDLAEHQELISMLVQKVGRLLFNGFPTGVEVCPAMHHGGPYPATTAPHFTSVGTAAIQRFVRPVCFQNFPQSALPVELRNRNERKIWRMVDGKISQDDLPPG
jgi:NADP-dependent aldehyde dehydrogenase